MKKILFFFFLVLTSLQLSAQRIEVDIFGNLSYESRRQNYRAYLKSDIFDNLIFTDNLDNEIIFKKKYLDLEYPKLKRRKEAKIDFFNYLMEQYDTERNYKATFSVDIFDKIIIEDNRNNRVESGQDIFGNPTYEEKRGADFISIRKNIFGELEYKSNRENALLKKDIFNKWIYTDSSGNKFEFGASTWNRLMDDFGSDEAIFRYLVEEYLANNRMPARKKKYNQHPND